MKIVEMGSGAPVVVIPGIQGRWEWMRPGVEALALRCRVVTFSLADEPTCGGGFDERLGFDNYVEQVRQAIQREGVPQVALCGVSYGALIAAAFAARYPHLVSSLILVSALPPGWIPDERVRFYVRAPRLLSPLFMVGSLRLYREIAASAPGLVSGLLKAARHGWNVLTHAFSPARMARRVRMLESVDLSSELRSLRVPTLIVTGTEELDRVVPVRRTWEYLTLWPHAQSAIIERTGHLGIITRPEEFAAIVAAFVEGRSEGADQRRRIV